MRLEEISEEKISELDRFLFLGSKVIAYATGSCFLYFELVRPFVQDYFLNRNF